MDHCTRLNPCRQRVFTCSLRVRACACVCVTAEEATFHVQRTRVRAACVTGGTRCRLRAPRHCDRRRRDTDLTRPACEAGEPEDGFKLMPFLAPASMATRCALLLGAATELLSHRQHPPGISTNVIIARLNHAIHYILPFLLAGASYTRPMKRNRPTFPAIS